MLFSTIFSIFFFIFSHRLYPFCFVRPCMIDFHRSDARSLNLADSYKLLHHNGIDTRDKSSGGVISLWSKVLRLDAAVLSLRPQSRVLAIVFPTVSLDPPATNHVFVSLLFSSHAIRLQFGLSRKYAENSRRVANMCLSTCGCVCRCRLSVAESGWATILLTDMILSRPRLTQSKHCYCLPRPAMSLSLIRRQSAKCVWINCTKRIVCNF